MLKLTFKPNSRKMTNMPAKTAASDKMRTFKFLKAAIVTLAISLGSNISISTTGKAGGGRDLDPWRLHPGSTQYSLLAPFSEFLRHIPGCCNLFVDGRAELVQKDNVGRDNEEFPYIVTITTDLSGNHLRKPHNLKIPKKSIIDTEDGIQACYAHSAGDQRKDCLPPPYNVIWYHDNSSHRGYVANETEYRVLKVFCFWPAPGVQ